MLRLKSVFKDTAGLHARINIVAANSSVIRIGLIPVNKRQQVQNVLNALVDDPLVKTPWAAALADRPLSKDTLVKQSAVFDYVETRNSLMVYPVPFKGPAVEYLEVSSLQDSWDHLKSCHLHIYLTNKEPPALSSEYPNLVVVDSSSKRPSSSQESVSYGGETIYVDSAQALQANAALQNSPENVSEYLELTKASNIATLRTQLTDRPAAVYTALKQSIIASCERQIAELPQQSEVNSSPRAKWSQTAHHELQSDLLPAVRSTLTHKLAWWKLYARSDDVDAELSSLIIDRGLPQSQAAFNYLEGQISKNNHDEYTIESTLPLDAAVPAITWLHNGAYTSVLTALAIQVPVVAMALLGALADGFSWYQMGALGLLGIVVGLRKLQTSWLRASSQFEKALEDVVLQIIRRGEERLFNIGEKTVLEQSQERKAMEDALQSAKTSLGQNKL